MSTNAQENIQQLQQRKLQTNQGHLSGRINSKRKIKTNQGLLYLTVLRLPAADSFSHPATIEVRSNYDLGEVDADWAGLVRLAGMPNNYETKTIDEDGDEVKTSIRSARNEFIVLDTN